MRQAFGQATTLIGILFAALSLIGFLQHVMQVGLAPIFAEILSWWQSWTRPIVEWSVGWLLNAFDWRLAQWQADAFTVGYLLTLWGWRAIAAAVYGRLPPESSLMSVRIFMTIFTSMMAYVLTLLLIGPLTGARYVIVGTINAARPAKRAELKRLLRQEREADTSEAWRVLHDSEGVSATLRSHHAFVWATGTVLAVVLFYVLNAFA